MMEKKKGQLVKLVYIIVLLLTVISFVKAFNSGDIKNSILCIISMFLYFVPYIINKLLNIMFPVIVRITFVLFIFATIILGEINDFYVLIPIWDDILHIVQGFVVSSVGFSLIYLLFKNKNIIRYEKILIALYSFCLSISVGVIWEVGEYITDYNMRVDMQKDKYIYEFKSILLNPKKNNEVIVVDKIGYTTIYDESGNKIITFNGYLDIGLHDTIDDLIDTAVGSILFCFIGCLYLHDKDKYDFIEIFIKKDK